MIFKVCRVIGISETEFFNFSGTERVKNVNKFRKQKAETLVIRRTQSSESKFLFSGDLKLKKHELNLEGFSGLLQSLNSQVS